MCKALETGVSGLFGPQSGATAAHIQSMCDALELPHVETRWDSRDIDNAICTVVKQCAGKVAKTTG